MYVRAMGGCSKTIRKWTLNFSVRKTIGSDADWSGWGIFVM